LLKPGEDTVLRSNPQVEKVELLISVDHIQEKTYYGLMKTMTISAFKTHISEELRRVRKGGSLVITDRETPIAEVRPIQAAQAPKLVIREPTIPFTIPRLDATIDQDPLEYLLEDRSRR
jgi:antitoxin (DNA-binding transcriptional repressor) of toxin-antitoxin stability system